MNRSLGQRWVAGLSLLFSSCGTHQVPAVSPSGAPQVGWVIMHGDIDNPDAEFACQSTPRTECIVPVSQPTRKTFSEVHVYFHSGATDTKFSGSVRIGFLGQNGTEIMPSLSAKAGAVEGDSVTGIVTERPGSHELSIEVTAVNAVGTQQIRERVPITVH